MVISNCMVAANVFRPTNTYIFIGDVTVYKGTCAFCLYPDQAVRSGVAMVSDVLARRDADCSDGCYGWRRSRQLGWWLYWCIG